MEDSSKLNYENKIKNNLFKFLLREFYQKDYTPAVNLFEILKLMIEMFYSKVSNLVKIKYVSVFILFILVLLCSFDENNREFSRQI